VFKQEINLNMLHALRSGLHVPDCKVAGGRNGGWPWSSNSRFRLLGSWSWVCAMIAVFRDNDKGKASALKSRGKSTNVEIADSN
jgi:hypothetical protein